jgi:hypothetical protein
LFVFRLIEQQITSIDLASFTRKLRQVRERLGRTQGSIVGPAIDNEALFLDQMEQVKMQKAFSNNKKKNKEKKNKFQIPFLYPF